MAKVTTPNIEATQTWQKIADTGQTFMLSVLSGEIWLSYSSASPSASAIGHTFYFNDLFGDSAITENCWVRSVGATAKITVTKE